MKKFLISIDTEGDNQWKWKLGDPIFTDNARFLPRFQELCEEYGFKPTYLTNYEIANDSFFVDYFKRKNLMNQCEIGMHLHAWNSPPDYTLPVRNDISPGAPYLIEYPSKIMEEKIAFMTELLESRFEKKPTTHRAGRWAVNQEYFSLLDQFGYQVDCSVTPMIDWSKAPGQSLGSFGADFTQYPTEPYQIDGTSMTEVPVTIRENHRLKSLNGCGARKALSRIREARIGHGLVWLRPRSAKENLDDMLYLADVILKEKNTDYLMFMIHSSELMPGGSPSFPDSESIEVMYSNIRTLFDHISKSYVGRTFREYVKSIR